MQDAIAPKSPADGCIVALLVPCLNEEATIGRVISSARKALPGIRVVVGDNGSTDDTALIAKSLSATVVSVSVRGKGKVMARLFADVDADVYVMVDGDDTYDLSRLSELVAPIVSHQSDMVIAARDGVDDSSSFKRGHRLGNTVLTWIFRVLFGLPITDTLSGYRALSRRFVKSLPVSATGFEIETDLNVHASLLPCQITNVPTRYRGRPSGSSSKLSTYKDGWRILLRNLSLFRDARPMAFFLGLAIIPLVTSVVLIGRAALEYFATGQVLYFPSLIVGVGFLILAAVLLQVGASMTLTAKVRRDVITLAFLRY